MLYIIAMFSSILAGMGIGGGSIFILLTTIFQILAHKEAQCYNLIMFLVVGIMNIIINYKEIKKVNLKNYLVPICLGSLIGITLLNIISEEKLKNYFYVFMILIGSYEIISSLKNIIKSKNNSVRKE